MDNALTRRGAAREGADAETRLDRTVTIYVCTAEGCPAFFGCDVDGGDPDGDLGWNPDGWPRCTEHKRPMQPVRVEAVRAVPHEHPAGCFYGSFAEAYPDAWHIPHDSGCRLDHGENPIQLEPPSAPVHPDAGEGDDDE